MVKVKIALHYPGTEEAGQYFSLPLKQELWDERTEYHKAKNILVVSNSQGDFKSLSRILLRREVTDKYMNWIFEDNHLVIICDGAQCNDQPSEYLWFIYYLQQKAQRDGGDVHFILGNRQILNLQGAWRYTHPKYAVVMPGSKDSVTALYYGNNELWHWLHNKNIIERIGSLLFVPRGISPAVNMLRGNLSEINELARSAYPRSTQTAGIETSWLLNSEDSPLFYKGYFDGTATEEQVNKTLRKFGTKIIVTAYEGAASGSYCNGKVINVTAGTEDEGLAGLLVKRKHFYLLNNKGKRERIKLTNATKKEASTKFVLPST